MAVGDKIKRQYSTSTSHGHIEPHASNSTQVNTIYVKKNATICKNFCVALIRNRATLLWFVREAPGYRIALPNTHDFCQIRRNLANEPHFHGKRCRNPWIAALYKTAHCDAAIKVRRFWWEKSSAHAAMFSSAATARLLHSF